MDTINYANFTKESLESALKGEYGTVTMPNGLTVTKAGRFFALWGSFADSTTIVEVPSMPVRYPLMFCGDAASGAAIVEPDSGFVDVPSSVRGGRFVVMGFALLR